MRIAHVSPAKDVVSETFVRYHKASMPGEVISYFGGFVPNANEIEGVYFGMGFHYYKQKVFNLLRTCKRNVFDESVYYSFKRQKVQVCFAEFGQTGVGVMRACKKAGIPLIVNFHGADVSVYENLEAYQSRYLELFEIAAAVVGVSRLMCQQLQSLGCMKSKIHYLPCYPDPRFLDMVPNLNSTNLLSVGRFVDKKAPYLTILAFQQAQTVRPSLTLNMVGDGPLLETCKNLVTQLRIGNVNFLGALAHEQVVDLYKDCFCFVQHSIVAGSGDSEGTPVSILEAAAAGIPIVSTRHAGIPDVVEDGAMGYLVDESDVNSMADRITVIADSLSTRVRMSDYSKKKIGQNYTAAHYRDRLASIISDAVELAT